LTYSFCENEWGEKYVEELNRSDFVSMKSAEFFDSVLEFELKRENTLYLVIGSDSGLLLPYLQKATLGRGSRLAVIEHDDVYPLIADEYRGVLATDKSTDSETVYPLTLHRVSTWCEELFDGTEVPWLTGGQIRVVESNASAADYSRLYMPILQSVKLAAKKRVDELSGAMNRRAFTEMQFRNAADSVNILKSSDIFGAHRTAIVLGGGPSLDMHLDWIKANREKLFIISVSRISGKLIKNEISPDLVASVDPYDISYEVSKQGILWTDVPIIYNFHISAKLLQQWQGPCFYMGKRLPWYTEKQLVGSVSAAGPTVGHAAAYAAAQLGFSQILLTGIDLCYTLSASTHSNDSPEQMIQKMPSLCDAKVEAYNGRFAGTSFGLEQSVGSLNKIGEEVNKDEIRMFNISAEAARCASIPYKDITDVVLPEDKPDFSTHMNTEVRMTSLDELDDLERELKLASYSFNQICSLCAKAKSNVSKMHAPNVGADAQKYASKLTKIRKRLEAEFPEYLNAIFFDNGPEFTRTQVPTDFDEMTREELIVWGRHYYKLMEKGARLMMGHIEQLQARIQLRRDEQDVDINVRQLAARWREDLTPGRLLRWKKINWKRVAPEDRAWVQRAVGKYRATLNTTSRATKEVLSRKNTDIDNVMKSLVFLHESSSLEELKSIEARLDNNVWPYIALKPFTNALIMQLDKDNTAALAQFQKSIDACSTHLEESEDSLHNMQRLIEECLVRMTHCYMAAEDRVSALTSLGMLAELIPSYVISYAKMLNLCGQQEFAIELLQSYIEIFPSNKKARFVLKGIAPDCVPGPDQEVDPVYVEKISGALDAIMGDKPEQTAY